MTKIRADLFSSGKAKKLGAAAVLLYAYLVELDQEKKLKGNTILGEEAAQLVGITLIEVTEGLCRLDNHRLIKHLSFDYLNMRNFRCDIAPVPKSPRPDRARMKHVTVRLPAPLVDEIRREGTDSGCGLGWALRRRLESAKAVIQ